MHLLLAHQGGWDEILYLVVPALGVILWVRWAERRARARAGNTAESATSIAEDSEPT